MRTTLDIDDDILRAVKELSRRAKKSAGAVLSELARKALTASPTEDVVAEPLAGFRPFPSRGVVVSDETVNRLREEDAY